MALVMTWARERMNAMKPRVVLPIPAEESGV